MLFSIIIPCYNVATYLHETLDSVLAQTCQDWECICVDDGSTDDTGQILDEYGRKDGRFRVVHKVNAGVSAARNDAMQLAQGDYISFLDGDDVWAPDWLMKVKEATQDGKADIVRMSFTFWHEETIGGTTPLFDTCDEIQNIVGEEDVLKWGWTTYTTDGYIWLNVIRRELIVKNEINFPDGMKINEDIIFDLKLLPYARHVVQSQYAGYFYRMRSSSAWHSKRSIEGCTRYLEESIKMWAKKRTELESLPCLPTLRCNVAYMFYCAVLQWLDFGLDEERSRANEISTLLQRAHRLDMLNLKAIPLYWRPSFLFAMISGSFSMIRITYCLLDVYHRIHKKLIMA